MEGILFETPSGSFGYVVETFASHMLVRWLQGNYSSDGRDSLKLIPMSRMEGWEFELPSVAKKRIDWGKPAFEI